MRHKQHGARQPAYAARVAGVPLDEIEDETKQL
jgi:hypothetical protein